MRAALVALLGLLTLVGCSAAPGTSPGPSQPLARAAGYSLTIPKLGIDNTPLAPVGLNPNHTIQVPPVTHPEQAAVYTGGPMPGQVGGGDRVGPAIILGHVNGNGRPGVFARLAELKAGDQITTTAPDGTTTTFVVYRAATVPKAQFSTHDVYSDVPGPELRLITCGGALDRTAHNYVSNVIVWAKRA